MYTKKDTYAELIKVLGRSNWLFLFFGIMLFALILDREIELWPYDLSVPGVKLSERLKNYRYWSVALWVASYSMIVYAFAMPVYRVKNHPFGRSIFYISASFAAGILILIMIVAYFRISTLEQNSTLVATIISAIITIFILIVKIQMDSHIRRSGNALQALLQMRLSEVYQKHIDNINKVYPSYDGLKISEDDVHLVQSVDPKSILDEANCDAELLAKINAIRSQVYILNYFEFLALGVKNFVLDEELLFESLGGIFIKYYKRSEVLIELKGDSKSYILIKDMYKRWSSRREKEVAALINADT